MQQSGAQPDETVEPLKEAADEYHADAPKFDLFFYPGAAFRDGEGLLAKWRADEGRANGVDADLVRGPFDGHAFRHAFQRVFGGAIDGTVEAANMAHLA